MQTRERDRNAEKKKCPSSTHCNVHYLSQRSLCPSPYRCFEYIYYFVSNLKWEYAKSIGHDYSVCVVSVELCSIPIIEASFDLCRRATTETRLRARLMCWFTCSVEAEYNLLLKIRFELWLRLYQNWQVIRSEVIQRSLTVTPKIVIFQTRSKPPHRSSMIWWWWSMMCKCVIVCVHVCVCHVHEQRIRRYNELRWIYF